MTILVATDDDLLDKLYFCLPITWGNGLKVASQLGVCHTTLRKMLRVLEAEGLVEHVGHGCWLEKL